MEREPVSAARRLAARTVALWPWLAAAASGAFLALAFGPWFQAWIGWVGLAPLMALVWLTPGGKHPRWRALGLGYVFGLVFFWIVFGWLRTVTGLGWFVLAFYLALYPAAFALFADVAACDRTFLRSGPNLLLAFSCAAAWTALEWVRGWLFSGFGWNGLYASQHENLPMIQFAEFTGVAGVTFLVALGNAIGTITVRRFVAEAGRTKIRPHYDFTVTMALVALAFGHGAKTLLATAPEGVDLKVAAIQPNIAQDEKFDPALALRNVDILARHTRTALIGEPHLVLWPESALPRDPEGYEAAFDLVAALREESRFSLLLGSEDADERGSYNAAMLVRPGDMVAQVYRKIHLVPFGEYIPFRHSFPLFAWIAGTQVPGDFVAGTQFTVFVLSEPPLNIGPLICFEDTLGDLTRKFVLAGADVLANVTNDGWFLRSSAADQHLAHARFRAVENRRPLLRCANTGVTAWVDACGRVRGELRGPDGSPFIEGFLAGSVRVTPGAATTFYTRHGDVFAKACCAWALAALGAAFIQGRLARHSRGG